MIDDGIKIVSVDKCLIFPKWAGNRCPDNLRFCFEQLCVAVIKIGSTSYRVKIEAGFTSDGGSIPRATGWLRGIAFIAYFFHDQLYTNHMFDRETCDKVLIALLRWEGVGESDLIQIYAGVRVFGGSHYDED